VNETRYERMCRFGWIVGDSYKADLSSGRKVKLKIAARDESKVFSLAQRQFWISMPVLK
jgi:hypothetical protein